jgi:competence protein ComEA
MRLCFATLVLLVAGVPALAQGLPDGSGKDVTITVCGKCHEAERVAAVRLTREGWQDVIANMVSLGAEATDEDLQAILEYLAMNFIGEAAQPLNMNTATNVELESVLQLLRKEAAAIIEYRKKHGKFKALDDLKKIPGVDFKKIEAKKDRLFF